MFLGCPSVCACMRLCARAVAFSADLPLTYVHPPDSGLWKKRIGSLFITLTRSIVYHCTAAGQYRHDGSF